MESELEEFLMNKGISAIDIQTLKDNEIDSSIFGLLRDSDINRMFAKVGPALRVTIAKECWTKQQTVTSSSYSVTTLPVPCQSKGPQRPQPVCIPEKPLPVAPVKVARSASNRLHTTIPLPNFSEGIQSALKTNKTQWCMSELVTECAYHILSHGDLRTNGAYQKFGEALCNRYPCLEYPGHKHRHTFITKKISKKLRNIRYLDKNLKKKRVSSKAYSIPGATVSSKEACVQSVHPSRDVTQCHPNNDTVELLFRESHFERRTQLVKMKYRNVEDILRVFPTLQDPNLLRCELELLVGGSVESMKERYRDMLHTLDFVFGTMDSEEVGDEMAEVSLLLKLQAALKDQRIKPQCRPGLSAITMTQAHKVDLKSGKFDPPHLIIAEDDSRSLQAWILADGRSIKCFDREDPALMVVTLMACYYAWNLQYPKELQILGFLQEYLICDKRNKFFKSDKFVEFQKSYEMANTKTASYSSSDILELS